MTERDRRLPGEIRRKVRDYLHLRNLDSRLAEAAEVLVTELVTNTLQYGPDSNSGFGVRLWPLGDRVYLEIGNGSSPGRSSCTWGVAAVAAADLREDSRGLLLVAGLADAWGTTADGTSTWCVLSVTADQ
ncbi:ATP-binding protein [Streptomyces sp. NPDC014894]|uniref:ATP-binding protein n=1 Tax=Streptomyces sp. NPDC014894 TaxID=3364931 RepID=UPI0036F8A1F8